MDFSHFKSYLKNFLYLPIELWLIGLLIVWKVGKIAQFYEVVPTSILVGSLLLLYIFLFKRSVPFFLNSALFQLWFYLSLRYNNFLLDRPVWNLFFFGLIYPFVILSWLGFFMDYDSFFALVMTYLLLITLYNRVVYIFLNPSIEGTSFEVSNPQDISWENIMKSVSSFCEYHTGRSVANKLGKNKLTCVFPNIQRRFMWRKAVEVGATAAENSGLVGSVVTVVTASAAVGGLIVQSSQHKENLRADAEEKQREREFQLERDRRDQEFQLERDRQNREFEAVQREKDRDLQRELFEKKEKLSAVAEADSGFVEVPASSKSISGDIIKQIPEVLEKVRGEVIAEEKIVKAPSLSMENLQESFSILEIFSFFF